MKKLIALLLAVVMALGMAACAKTGDNSGPVIDDQSSSAPESSAADDEPVEVTYVRGDDEVAYENALANFEALLEQAEALEDVNERFVLFAQAEAELPSHPEVQRFIAGKQVVKAIFVPGRLINLIVK